MRFIFFVSLSFTLAASAFPMFSDTDSPKYARHMGVQACVHAKQSARKFILPQSIANFTSKVIPDEDHAYRPPCQFDRRGPCPALNTLANHGYLPRNGVATTEHIIEAVMEGFGMSADVAAFLASYGTLTRGNANTATLSIGDADELVPPLPGCIDGPIAGGLSKAGRIEGDVSLSREDASEGSPSKFSPRLFDELLLFVGKFGNNSPGNETTLNSKVFEEFIRGRYNYERANDPKLSYRVGRQLISLAATALVLELFPSFPNGVSANLTVPELSSFFRNERFPDNWVRRAPAAGLAQFVPTAGGFFAAITMNPPDNTKVQPGRNINGTFVKDGDIMNILCEGYTAVVENDIPAVFTQQTGILKENIDTMLAAMLAPFAAFNCTAATPKGQAGL